MAIGKSIRIYLADGTAAGIRHGQIDGWTGQAISCPRTQFGDLKNWLEEVRRPGIYFLFGNDDQSAQEAAYIGQSEIVVNRLGDHVAKKAFWNEVVIFTSKDDLLTNAHARYLESRLYSLASVAGRYQLENDAAPQEPSLPRADRDVMEEFLESIRTLLGVLRHRLLEPIAERPVGQTPQPATVSAPRTQEEITEFVSRSTSLVARAIRTNEGIVVRAGSMVNPSTTPTLSPGYKAVRDQLLASGVIRQSDGKLIFASDHLFPSPSQAAAIIVGHPINGRDWWRTRSGKSWGDIEDQIAQNLLTELESTPEKGA